MERIIKTAEGFQLKIAVCTNKYDSNIEITEKIEAWCREMGLPYAGRIPFDSQAVKAVNNGLSVVDVDCPAGRAVKDVFRRTIKILDA